MSLSPPLLSLVAALLGVAFGAAGIYVLLVRAFMKSERRLSEELNNERMARVKAESEAASRAEALQTQADTLLDAEKRFADLFSNLSHEALAKSTDHLLKLAKENYEKHAEGASGDLRLRQQAIEELVKPLKDSIEKLDQQTQEIEKKRLSAYDGVSEHINRLIRETSQLSNALRRPNSRGSWGELTLRKAAESAGLIEGQDFDMQFSTETDEGRLRPDMVVRLSNDAVIVVDSKVPLDSYLEAMEAQDDATKTLRLRAHAAQVRRHVQSLSSKSYWSQFKKTPDFVVMFVPAESLYQAALEQDPELMEMAFKARVILANPMTLIALLRTVAYGLNQEKVRENALAIRLTGEKLYDSIRVFSTHMASVGRHLSQTNEAFNRAVGSMERNVLSKSRQLKEMGAGSGDEIETPESVSVTPRGVIESETPLSIEQAPESIE